MTEKSNLVEVAASVKKQAELVVQNRIDAIGVLSEDTLFERIWQAIKHWDIDNGLKISGTNIGGYAGVTGDDVRLIINAISGEEKMKLVKIDWIDSHGVSSEWELKDEMESLKPVCISSVGWLLEDNSEYKTILQSDSGKQVLGRMTIPIGCIKKITLLINEHTIFEANRPL